MSEIAYVLRHPRTTMFIADKKDANPRFKCGHRSGFGQSYKWVRTTEDAAKYGCFADAELPAIFLDLTQYEVCPLLSCGLVGDPVSRETAMANGTFHRRTAA